MALVKLAAFTAAGYAIYKIFGGSRPVAEHAAFAPGETTGAGHSEVRNAGPAGMRSDPPQWDSVDEASDESFPASDPPGKY